MYEAAMRIRTDGKFAYREDLVAREELTECRRENERLERCVRTLIEQREEHDGAPVRQG